MASAPIDRPSLPLPGLHRIGIGVCDVLLDLQAEGNTRRAEPKDEAVVRAATGVARRYPVHLAHLLLWRRSSGDS